MNILFVQESDWLTRGPHQQHQLADRLSLKGHHIRVIDYEIGWREQSPRKLRSSRQVFNNVSKVCPTAAVMVIRPDIVKMPVIDYVSLVFSHKREIGRQIKEFAPDVIVGFGILNAYLALNAARKADIPFVYYWIDVLHRLIPFKPLQPLGKMLESRILKRADKVLTINQRLEDFVIEMGAPIARTQMIRAGVDLTRFDPALNSAHLRVKYGIANESVVLFFMGWLYHFSGLKEVALDLAKDKSGKLVLLIVGEGDAYQELLEMREKHGLHDRIILAGKKPYEEMPGFIAASDICLLPAYPQEKVMLDIVPIKMYEYAAMAKPVIATKLPGIVAEFGSNNGVVYVNGPEDAVDRALELSRSGDLAELGTRARRFVEKFSWGSITDEFELVLRKVAEENKHA